MGQKASYYEVTKSFGGDPLLMASRIVRGADPDNYILYEFEDTWCLGMGIHTRVVVYPDRTVVTSAGGEQVIENDRDLSQTLDATLTALPVDGWRVYGTGNFEMARFLYGLPLPSGEPMMTMFVPEEEVRVDSRSIILRALDAHGIIRLEAIVEGARRGEYAERLAEPLALAEEIATHGAEEYKESVRAALTEIMMQQYRKVILSRRVALSSSLDMVASYVTGRRANEPARSYMLRLDGLEAAGFSPETVAEVTADREVFTTPLAGTRSTGDDLHQEVQLGEDLLGDSKELAEHAVSVYAAFDELTMACDPTSVRVVDFMLLARRGAVQHLASRVSGKLLEKANPWFAFNALFPAVTASGVPKLESVDAIGRLEPRPRGLYAGCVLIYDQSGMLDAALVLRSFYQRDGQAWIQAGAGIMNMSSPARELEETREKMSSVAPYLIPSSG